MVDIEKETRSIYAEAFRTIKTNIKYSFADKNKKVFLITSSEAGEGKSTVATNLAISFSQENKKVLLIDCDLRRPTIHRQFKVSGIMGLTEVLIGEKKLSKAIKSHNEYLDIISSGNIPPNPAELLSSDAMTELLEDVKDKYDYIILDSTPLGVVADAQILLGKVDGTVLVVRANKTKREKLINCKEIIDQVKGKIIGVVLNRVDDKSEQYYYY